MRLVVFGDIHANIVALERCYEEATRLKPDRIIHLADLGGYAPFVNEVTEFMVKHSIEGVQGNYDYNVAHDTADCGCYHRIRTACSFCGEAKGRGRIAQDAEDFFPLPSQNIA